jgi:integrase
VERLAHRYIDDHLSGLSAAIPGKADLPAGPVGTARIGAWKVTAWTSADSSAVIAAVRPARCSDALVQHVGAAMRALVTHARRLRWLTTHSEDPMCMVRYAKTASIQGAASVYVPRSTLPTDEQCAALFDAMAELGHRRWAVAMRLTHRSGLRWGELVALQAHDIEFEPARVVHVRRAVEQPTRGPARLKTPKNGKTCTTIFPKSVVGDLRALLDETTERDGPDALLFPSASGRIIPRSDFSRSGSAPPRLRAGP